MNLIGINRSPFQDLLIVDFLSHHKYYIIDAQGYFLFFCQECEGLQAILIDWQGGFLGSVANDLMWALYPFLEAKQQDKVLIWFTERHSATYRMCL